MILVSPLPDRADQTGSADTLVAGDERRVETNRRSGNQSVERVQQLR